MLVECILFWLTIWLFSELASVQTLATQLALVLLFIVLYVFFLLSLDLELLAFFILSTYASAFIAISLVGLQFGPFWGATRFTSHPQNTVGLFFFAILGLTATLSGAVSTPDWSGFFLWQDLLSSAVSAQGSQLQCSALHWFFYQCFLVETLGLNLYLFLGLVFAVLLLNVRWAFSLLQGGGHADTTPSQTAEGRHRIRLITQTRRATRRTAASTLRFRASSDAAKTLSR